MSADRMTCPYCGGGNCDAEFVDIGVGAQQVTPYSCADCRAVQMNPYDKPPNPTAGETATGWHAPMPEAECPGHVASATDAKICALCGVSNDELRPPEDGI